MGVFYVWVASLQVDFVNGDYCDLIPYRWSVC